MEVVLQNITKIYGRTVAVRNVNLIIKDGEFLSIVGPSGCGKTTTLRLIAGFTKPDRGKIIFNGEVVNEIPPRSRNVGIVFQNYALFPNMSVYDNIAFGLRARSFPEEEIGKKVRELVEMVRLEGKEDRLPRQLSGGEQQRVALARALAISPKILLLDEPLSALDAKVRLMLRYEIKRIQRQSGITTVYVTHDQEEALSISDSVAVMDRGVILQVGTPEEIYSSPKNEFVASFIGISNLFQGKALFPEKGEISWEEFVLKVPPFRKEKDEVTVMVRPEKMKIILSESEISPSERLNVLPGLVEGKVFFGPTIRLAVRIGRQRVLIDVPNVEKYRLEGGEKVLVSFEREDSLIL